MIFVAANFGVGQFWSTGIRAKSEAYLQLEEILSKKKIQRFILDDKVLPLVIEGVKIIFLNPPGTEGLQRMSRNRMWVNNTSLVLRLQFRNVSFLLPGDIGQEAEYRMMREGYSLKSDLLKVPHHGSASSSSPDFLERVKPAYAIFTVGERNIGHLPNPEVMKRYRQIGSRIFRTDRDGAITVITDGEKIEIKTFTKSEN